MKFIELASGVSIRKDEIISVEKLATGGCVVRTESNSFDSNFEYETVLMLLENSRMEEEVVTGAPVNGMNIYGAQHWRG